MASKLDEVSIADYEKLVPLLESIYVCDMWREVNRLCMKNCLSCEMGLLSQKDHDCLTLPGKDRRNIYGKAAAEIFNNEHFIEAIRVLRLPFHKTF